MTTTAPAAGRFAPSVLNPADVEYVESWDNNHEDGNPPALPYLDALRARLAPEARSRGLNVCTMCGQSLRYVTIMEVLSTEELFVVGEDCAESVDLAARIGSRVSDLRARAADRRENRKVQQRLDDLYVKVPALRDAFDLGREDGHPFIIDVARRAGQTGILSDRQIDAVLRAADGITADRERAAAEALLPHEPVVAGDAVEITGEIVSIYTRPGYTYNSTVLKMVVRDDRGFKVCGTFPAAFYTGREHDSTVGGRVTFTAKVTASDDDPEFGFYKSAKGCRRAEYTS